MALVMVTYARYCLSVAVNLTSRHMYDTLGMRPRLAPRGCLVALRISYPLLMSWSGASSKKQNHCAGRHAGPESLRDTIGKVLLWM
ncbi:hypothetical protein BAUCODRAFT_172174 [Baudoinia panamericana UAMH 10762]|uniref:Uncharacterized protein n=1 Tax=Baudoinia panamericana (strain UAMH 10762) TaxID=717646 RepID=M2N8R9_BAUPA|nr:uncharacterized protein BAUCODRAFT_172174 [Baudoinia panamericana UAMH 10762]EMD00524.1 hypothetical protein BAUCODRAFT_172174 [Baudoinia panamericana UAMH 10762]